MTYKEITPLQRKEIISFYKETNGNLSLTSQQFKFISKWSIRNLLQEEKIYGTFKKDETVEEKSRKKSVNVINWKKQKKIMLIEYKGGKCEVCGYNKCIAALEFHHVDPKQKDFSISTHSFSYKKMKQEVDKCMLVCSNCHREIHYLKK